jgi:hypothetical protein
MSRRTRLLDRTVQTKRDAFICLIVVEGQKTEPAWLRWFISACCRDQSRIKIEVVDSGGNSAPRRLLDRAEERAREMGLQGDDERWLVFDVDQYEEPNKISHLLGVIRDASNKRCGLAISNPSFEVWLLHHHVDPLPAPLDDARAAEQRLRELLGAYNKARLDDAHYSSDKVRLAVARAKAQAPDGLPWPQKPGTHVWRLVERLLEATGAARGVL